MRSFALKLVALWGWRRALLAAVLGAIASLSMAPFEISPVLLVCFPILVWLLDGARVQARSKFNGFTKGFWIGLCFGFGYFLAGLHWIGSAFLVDAETFAWMIPVVLAGLMLLLAAFWGLACGLAVTLWTGGAARIITLAALLAGAEWLRGHIFTGFPWNLLGYAVSGSEAWSQFASLVGVYGLSFAVVAVAASPALLAADGERRLVGVAGGWLWCAVFVFAAVLSWLAGNEILNAPAENEETALRVRVVQPNIAQEEKWDPVHRSRIFASYLELSDTPASPEFSGVNDVDILIWPESALPFFLEESPDALAAIAAILPAHVTLVTGGLRLQSNGDTEDVYNSVLVLDGQANVLERFDKFHLVPFGEYLPLEELLSGFGFRQLVTVPLGFKSGEGAATINVSNVPAFSPLICYEIIFPGAVSDPQERPQWLLNVTNDAWFGDSIGPHQHFENARFRAIEEGLPIIRAANTGISAVVDSRGRVLAELALGAKGTLDTILPAPAPPTFYAQWRDIPLAIAIGCSLLLTFFAQFVESRVEVSSRIRQGFGG